MFGAFAPMPLRLGGGQKDGWTASQQSRSCADLSASQPAVPLATLTLAWDGVAGSLASVSSYHGQDGSGLAFAPSVARNAAGDFTLTWSVSREGPLWVRGTREDQVFPYSVRTAMASPAGASRLLCACSVPAPNSVRVVLSAAGQAVVEAWGEWTPVPSVGTYGGDPDKEDSVTEGLASYASACYAQIQADRGTAYTSLPGTAVYCENLAWARFWGHMAYRLPEKVRANAVPGRSDERLDYWSRLLGVPPLPGEERWRLRRRCAQAFRIAEGASYSSVRAAVEELLGDTLAPGGLSFPPELPLDQLPPGTYYYPADTSYGGYSLTGGSAGVWISRRSQLRIQVRWLATQTWQQFYDLVNVRLFQLLDTILPSWMTWAWFVANAGGFVLDRDIPGTNSAPGGSPEANNPSIVPGRFDIDGFNDQGYPNP